MEIRYWEWLALVLLKVGPTSISRLSRVEGVEDVIITISNAADGDTYVLKAERVQSAALGNLPSHE